MNLAFGEFSHPEPLLKLLSDGRNMQVMEPDGMWYRDPQGRIWRAEYGDISDGASIPSPLWPIVGGPWEGLHRLPAIFHDRGCKYHKNNAERRAVDWMIYQACLCAGCSDDHARRIYVGVSVGSLNDALGDYNAAFHRLAPVALASDHPGSVGGH